MPTFRTSVTLGIGLISRHDNDPNDHPGHRISVLALNNEHAEELSWLEPERLSFLISQAFYARCIGELEAFLLAFDHDADYDSPEFPMVQERYPRFVYVDRIAVAGSARGRGHARILYHDCSTMRPGRSRRRRLRGQFGPAQSCVRCVSRRAGIFRSRPGDHPRRGQIGPLLRQFADIRAVKR